jgi:arabinan endo-1,5-alpha-L-arabinosidase
VTLRFVLVALFVALAAVGARAQEQQQTMSGDVRIHDPSVIEVDGKYAAFYTGQEGSTRGAIRVKTSPDGITWTEAGSVGKGLPKWVRKTLGFQPPNIWAPSISRHGDVFNLYYSVSVFGVNTSAIGLMTNSAFNPERPGEGWEDQELVLQSSARDDWNAIDPWRIDTSDGRAWLAYGSFWSGIKLRELDPKTGKLIAEDAPTFDLAPRGGAGVEAASILEHEGRFYLFVSFDQCCRGIQSTYNMRVGRADTVTGPYVDRDGKPMLQGGGTLLLGSTGRFVGPGGQEGFVTSQGDMLAFHYYDGADLGVPKLQISPLDWTPDGWPELPALPE